MEIEMRAIKIIVGTIMLIGLSSCKLQHKFETFDARYSHIEKSNSNIVLCKQTHTGRCFIVIKDAKDVVLGRMELRENAVLRFQRDPSSDSMFIGPYKATTKDDLFAPMFVGDSEITFHRNYDVAVWAKAWLGT